jgi:DNA-binding NarL/FixJ family response regulator
MPQIGGDLPTGEQPMMAVIRPVPGHDQHLAAAIATLTTAIRREQGCLEFRPFQDVANPAGFYPYEIYADILSLLAGHRSAPPSTKPRPPLELLSRSELRVLRYLPTNLTGPEIARELYVSHNTVRTHITHLYAKLGTHTRAEAVARARALGLLAPSPLPGKSTRPG